MMFDYFNNEKERKQDRILVLKIKEGAKPISSKGLPDPRLFTGENNLHVIQDKTSLWYFRYDVGGLPEPLKGKYTTFEDALKFAKKYYNTRNVEIVEVID